MNAPGGVINLASAASPGEVIPNASGTPDLRMEGFKSEGNINLAKGGFISTRGEKGGTVVIRGGRLEISSQDLDHASGVSSTTEGNMDGAETGVDIGVTGDLLMPSGQIAASSFGGGRAGNIKIKAADIEIGGDPKNSKWTSIGSLANSTGHGGSVEIKADGMTVKDGAYIDTYAGSDGAGGNMSISSNRVDVENGGFIGTYTSGTGTGGDLKLDADSLRVLDGGVIVAFSIGEGTAGKLEATADNIFLSGANSQGGWTGISAYTRATGAGGDLTIRTKDLEVRDGAEVSAYTGWSGNAGSMRITADHIKVAGSGTGTAGIYGNTFGSGKGADIDLTADSIEMSNRCSLQADAFGEGDAGNIRINTGSLEVRDAAKIGTAGYYGLGGNSGNTEITADRVLFKGLESSPDPFGMDFTGVFAGSSPQGGRAGNITIDARTLVMSSRSELDSSSFGPGRGGDVVINAQDVQVLTGSNIISSAFGSGDGGSMEIVADNLSVIGVHPEYYTDITGHRSLVPSGLGSQAGLSTGSAGDIRLQVGSLELLDGGRITVETFGSGEGGSVEVMAKNILISGVNESLKDLLLESGSNPQFASAGILSNTGRFFLGDAAAGNAGDIKIEANNIEVNDGGLISCETETPGHGGSIAIKADNVRLSSQASISSESRASVHAGDAGNIVIAAQNSFQADNSTVLSSTEQAKGGNITIRAKDIALTGATEISSQSTGEGNAGDISFSAADSFVSRDSAVNTEARQADGGNIHIQVQDMVHLVNSKISASVGGGPETVGGNIYIDPDYVVLDHSSILANAFKGKGGNIRIIADTFLADPYSLIDASSALGIDGTVDIRGLIAEFSGELRPLPKDYLSAAELLKEPCAVRLRGGEFSSFIITGRDALPIQPDSLMPSPFY